jgi:hypothetical protein
LRWRWRKRKQGKERRGGRATQSPFANSINSSIISIRILYHHHSTFLHRLHHDHTSQHQHLRLYLYHPFLDLKRPSTTLSISPRTTISNDHHFRWHLLCTTTTMSNTSLSLSKLRLSRSILPSNHHHRRNLSPRGHDDLHLLLLRPLFPYPFLLRLTLLLDRHSTALLVLSNPPTATFLSRRTITLEINLYSRPNTHRSLLLLVKTSRLPPPPSPNST